MTGWAATEVTAFEPDVGKTMAVQRESEAVLPLLKSSIEFCCLVGVIASLNRGNITPSPTVGTCAPKPPSYRC